jgi:hypothetical protein
MSHHIKKKPNTKRTTTTQETTNKKALGWIVGAFVLIVIAVTVLLIFS